MTDDELKYELFRLKIRSKINRKEIQWQLFSFYILSVIISLELFFVEYDDLTFKDLIIANIIIMMLFLVIFILFCTLNYIKFFKSCDNLFTFSFICTVQKRIKQLFCLFFCIVQIFFA